MKNMERKGRRSVSGKYGKKRKNGNGKYRGEEKKCKWKIWEERGEGVEGENR